MRPDPKAHFSAADYKARLPGVNSRAINSSKHGPYVPTVETLLKIPKAHDKPLSWFMESVHDDEPDKPK